MSSPLSERPFREVRVGGCVQATLWHAPGGVMRLRSTEDLQLHPQRMSDVLAHWAEQAPERTALARRAGGDGEWQRLSYAELVSLARGLGQVMLDLGLSVERPLALLCENSLEHAAWMMAGFWVGVPTISISPSYALLSKDYGKLRHLLATTTPGAVFVADARFEPAVQALLAPEVPVIVGQGTLAGRPCLCWDTLRQTRPGPAVEAARAATGPDTVAKLMFTSGSTRLPKAVITTHRMLCANQQMLRQCMPFLMDEPPVLVDWLPWNHTFGGNHNLGIALYNGGTLYIDDGKPTPAGMVQTIRNLSEIAPTVYFNVPRGLEELAHAMDRDPALRQSLFSRCQAFMFAAAGLSQAVWDHLDRHGEAALGQRLRVLSGLGMTETSPTSMFLVGTHARAGYIGLPCPGVEVKLVPVGDKLEVRFRGPHVMPGYWRSPEQTAQAFDEEGFYCTGDAVTLVDPQRLSLGLRFDGRIAEDFKLSTGTFVSVGPLRARVIAAGDPLILDVVLAAPDRDDLSALVFPRLGDCAALAGLPAGTPADEVLRHPAVKDFFQAVADRLWQEGTGSANRIARLHLLREPPSVDAGEITDKGSINQRAVLTHRADLVQALCTGDPAVDILRARHA
ncbi:feruloyl-CoA synthase [Ideonella sp. B508-1]|uniref:feruloyl-CoA synthase n=1 Tax=Ideonella sp. B508-1 TaxID=137716 RepID=UPI00034BB83B|nr:feruloyl-CoA synthase [Ideonella sp. B508-1]